MVVSADGSGVVSHAGARLLGDLAEQITLTERLPAVLAGLRPGRTPTGPPETLIRARGSVWCSRPRTIFWPEASSRIRPGTCLPPSTPARPEV